MLYPYVEKPERFSLLKIQIHNKLKANGIQPNSQSWHDYSAAKEIIIGDRWIKDTEKYDFIIQTIVDYLQV